MEPLDRHPLGVLREFAELFLGDLREIPVDQELGQLTSSWGEDIRSSRERGERPTNRADRLLPSDP
jgi:hypothetical protein